MPTAQFFRTCVAIILDLGQKGYCFLINLMISIYFDKRRMCCNSESFENIGSIHQNIIGEGQSSRECQLILKKVPLPHSLNKSGVQLAVLQQSIQAKLHSATSLKHIIVSFFFFKSFYAFMRLLSFLAFMEFCGCK